LLFINRGKIPLFYKKQYQGRKSKGKGITSKKILKKKNLFEIFLSEVMPGKKKRIVYDKREKHPLAENYAFRKIDHAVKSFCLFLLSVYIPPDLCIWR